MVPARILLTLALAIILGNAAAAPLPRPFSAHYTVHADGLKVGEMKRSLKRREDGSYILRTETYTTGLVALFKKDHMREYSIWTPEGDHPRPQLYHFRHSGRDQEIIERLDFDWERGIVTSLRDGKETEVAVEPGTLDKLNYQVALRRDLARGERVINYEVADRGDIRTYRFRVRSEESLVTDLGKLKTLKVERLSHDEQRKTFLWCAVDLDYLVVQIRQEDDGHVFASYITEGKLDE